MQASTPVSDLGCCTPLAREPLTSGAAVQLATVLKALADPARLRLLSLIQAHEGGEVCVCDLMPPLGLRQPTASHHLKVLHDAGLIDRERRGVGTYYRARSEALRTLAGLIRDPAVQPAPS